MTSGEQDLPTRAVGKNPIWRWLNDNPMVWSGVALALALAFFAAFLANVIPGMGYWVDELFSFWAGDPRISFAEAFRTRILPDSNAPIYFSLVYLVQAIGLADRTAFLVLNLTVFAALFALTIERGRRMGMLATAISAVAVILVSGPLLAYAPEGRVYGMAMAACAALAFCCAGAVAGFKPKRSDLVVAGILSVLAAWMHVFAGVFAGALAAALVITGWLVLKRREVVVLGFVVGLATVAANIVWLAFALPLFTGTTDWMTFTPADVFNAIFTFKELFVGPIVGLALAGAFVGLSFLLRHSRASALVVAITGALFFTIPFVISLKMPMYAGRYLLIAGPGLLVLLLFVLRSHLLEAAGKPLWRKAALALGALFFVFPVTQGAPAAKAAIVNRHDWRGAEIVVPAIGKCPAGEVRTLFVYDGLWGFEYFLKDRLKAVPPRKSPIRDVSTIDCPVYGWAETYEDVDLGSEWYKTADMARVLRLFGLTNTTNMPLEIIRHEGGLVLVRKDAASG